MAFMNQARRRLTVRAIERAITRGDNVDWWVIKAYDQLDAGVITDDDIAEIEALANAYYDALAEESSDDGTASDETSGE